MAELTKTRLQGIECEQGTLIVPEIAFPRYVKSYFIPCQGILPWAYAYLPGKLPSSRCRVCGR